MIMVTDECKYIARAFFPHMRYFIQPSLKDRGPWGTSND